MKKQVCITVEIGEQQDWGSLRLLLKALLRRHNLRCIGLSEPEPRSGVVSNEPSKLPSVPVKSMEKFPNAKWLPRGREI